MAVGLDLVQLHGQEGPAYTAQIELPVIKVIHVDCISDDSNKNNVDNLNGKTKSSTADFVQQSLIMQAHAFSGHAVALLLDSRAPGSAGGGGTGKSFDWSLSSILQEEGIPIIFAGGLHPDNVGVLVSPSKSGCHSWKIDNIAGVDVSSGVEESERPGVKSHAKIQSFIDRTRNNKI